jgi:uncharacterized repeat protein (TIGR03803 family)
MTQGPDGNIYGTTEEGGAGEQYGYGTVFKVSPSGVQTVIHEFDGSDGDWPSSALVLGTDADFYGTTLYGGANSQYGTAFKITPSGTFTMLHDFNGKDGYFPYGGVIQGTDGNFYGTTSSGGAYENGNVYKMTPAGVVTVLYSFSCSLSDCPDGEEPVGGLVQANDGNFYGTAQKGGTNLYGTVFKITPGGTLTTIHSFDMDDGEFPVTALVQGSDGDFYGTTVTSIFKITPSGELTKLHTFTDGNDGGDPQGALIQGSDGNFYGTTSEAGADGQGTAFEITPEGMLTTLHAFDRTDGRFPYAPLFQATNGTFYGTAPAGGASADGTAFSISVGLGAFVETVPVAGTVGTTVRILGSDLNGATGVSFNGVPATFTIFSKTEIKAKVPAGATTGNIVVTGRSYSLSSNVAFQVLQ